MTNTGFQGSNSQEKIEKIRAGRDHKIWDCGSPLYDSYELVTFAHIIERKLMPFSPPARSSGLTLRALMDKDKDTEDCSYALTTTRECSIHRRKNWWSGNKNDYEKKVETKKKTNKMFACILWWNSFYKKLFF